MLRATERRELAVMSEWMRIDRFLSGRGIGTRKELKEMAKTGRIRLNGSIVKTTDIRMDPSVDRILVDGREISASKWEYYMLHKPQGVISATTDGSGRTVIDLLRESAKDKGMTLAEELFPVGRLDKDTEGLLVITNDGEMAHRLLSPSRHVRKVYFARIDGIATAQEIEQFANGVLLKDKTTTKPAGLRVLTVSEEAQTCEVEVTLYEGKYHQVKRMFAACGLHVSYLKRLAMGNLFLDQGLATGEFRALTKEELSLLQEE